MDFKSTMQGYKSLVEEELNNYFDYFSSSVSWKDPFIEESLRLLKDYTLRGGKRVRPILTIMSYRGYSGDLSDTKIIKPATSWEFLQAYVLTHDDLIDNAVIRRGKPTPHVWISNWFKEKVDNDEKKADLFGKNISIVLGDLFNHMGYDLLLKSDFDEHKKREAIEVYNNTAIKTGKGEVMDIWLNEGRGGSLTEKEHYALIDRKTVEYTVKQPIIMGAKLAGVEDKKELEILTKASFPLGRAFQLQDDLLDYFANEQKLKKAVMTDLREGKYTIMLIKALENATPQQKTKLKNYMGKKQYTQEEIDEIRKVMKDTGSLDYSKQLIKQNVKNTLEYIDELNSTEEFKNFLKEYAKYSMVRDY